MPIRVKLYGSYSAQARARQFPGSKPIWGDCEFIFDVDCRDYDWLVIYTDLPSTHSCEQLACSKQQTLLVTTEPSTIKIYGSDYTAQFGSVLTSQAEWALPHRRRIFSQPALQWFYGVGNNYQLTYDQMMSSPPLAKTKNLSTVCSSKQHRHTLHNRRYRFTQKLKKLIPEMEIFGQGVRPIEDKAEALDDYRYHLTIENFIGPHHWTEKLSDAFLGATLPFYSGCPNAADYFPPESFIPIDINDVDGTAEIIKNAILNNEYEKRLPHILEARRLVLEEYNLFSVLSREIEQNNRPFTRPVDDCWIYSIKELRRQSPLIALRHFYEKCRQRIYYLGNYFN
jgi:hypothetical protein